MEQVKWGFDAASIEQQIGEHRRTHNAIGDYRWHLDKVKTDLVIMFSHTHCLVHVYSIDLLLFHYRKEMLKSSSSSESTGVMI